MLLLRRMGYLLPLLVLLAACQIQETTPPTPALTPTPAKPTLQPDEPDGWRIGLTSMPASLNPYSGQRETLPIVALLYPPPVLPLGSAGPSGWPYTSTGVLQELPSLQNGGVVTQSTTVFLDAKGTITTTVTEHITEVRQLVVTYHWNPTLRWSDGQPVTAEDSLFAYQVARASRLTPETARRLELTERYEVVDQHTTRAYLPPGQIKLDYLLTAWPPLPRHALADIPLDQVFDHLARNPLGYGPYTLTSWQMGELQLSRRPTAASDYPEQVTFRFVEDLAALRTELMAGRIDVGVTEEISSNHLPFLIQDRHTQALQVHSVPGSIWEHLDFNVDVKPFDDWRVRQAVAYGTNRVALSADLYGGMALPMHSWIVQDSWAYSSSAVNTYPYQPERAQELLDEAGLRDHDGDGLRELEPGVPLTATLLTTAGSSLREEVAHHLQEDLRTLGISVSVEMLPAKELYSPDGPLFHRQFTLAVFGWLRAPEPDGAVLWSCAAVPTAKNGWTGNNFAGWCDLEADVLIRHATTTLDWEQRRAAYARHQQIFTQALPILPLFARPKVLLARPEVEGLKLDTFAPLVWNIRRWYREQ